jgi:hypothetical protein
MAYTFKGTSPLRATIWKTPLKIRQSYVIRDSPLLYRLVQTRHGVSLDLKIVVSNQSQRANPRRPPSLSDCRPNINKTQVTIAIFVHDKNFF